MATPTSDPDTPLSPGERQVLRLLGEGNTAKSIAATLGLSEGAVNERLRAARRKTGVGSSRELARALASQENRDEKIGMAPAAPPLPVGAAPRSARSMGAWMMAGVIFVVAGVAAAMLMAPPADPAADPLIGQFMAPAGKPGQRMPRARYVQLRAEVVDRTWAPAAEARLRTLYEQVSGVRGEQLRITCRATLCEVAAILDAVSGRTDPPLEALTPGLLNAGFEIAMSGLHNDGLDPKQTRLLVYLKRVAPTS